MRSRGQPITYFGETDIQRAERLHKLEEREPTERESGSRNDFGDFLRGLDDEKDESESTTNKKKKSSSNNNNNNNNNSEENGKGEEGENEKGKGTEEKTVPQTKEGFVLQLFKV